MGNVLQTSSSETSEKPSITVDLEKKKDSNIKSENCPPNAVTRPCSDRPSRPIQLSRASTDLPRPNLRPKSETLRPSYDMTRTGDCLPCSKNGTTKPSHKASSGIGIDEGKRPLRVSEDPRINRKDMQVLLNIQGQEEKDEEEEEKEKVVAYFGKEKRARVKSELRVRFEDEVREHFKSPSRQASCENRSNERGNLIGMEISTSGVEARFETNKLDDGSTRVQRPKSDIPVRSKERQMAQYDKQLWSGRMCRADTYQDSTLGLTIQNISRLSRSMGRVGLKEDIVEAAPKTGNVLGECYAVGKTRLRVSSSVATAHCFSRHPFDEGEECERECFILSEGHRQPPSRPHSNESQTSESPPAGEARNTDY